MLFHCKPVNQQKTSIFALILWQEQRLNRFWSEKRCRNSTFTLGSKKSVLPSFLTYTWRCENITARPCDLNPLFWLCTWCSSRFLCVHVDIPLSLSLSIFGFVCISVLIHSLKCSLQTGNTSKYYLIQKFATCHTLKIINL